MVLSGQGTGEGRGGHDRRGRGQVTSLFSHCRQSRRVSWLPEAFGVEERLRNAPALVGHATAENTGGG